MKGDALDRRVTIGCLSYWSAAILDSGRFKPRLRMLMSVKPSIKVVSLFGTL